MGVVNSNQREHTVQWVCQIIKMDGRENHAKYRYKKLIRKGDEKKGRGNKGVERICTVQGEYQAECDLI